MKTVIETAPPPSPHPGRADLPVVCCSPRPPSCPLPHTSAPSPPPPLPQAPPTFCRPLLTQAPSPPTFCRPPLTPHLLQAAAHPGCPPFSLQTSYGGAVLTEAGWDLLSQLLAWDPDKRMSAEDALKHR